MRSLKTVFCCLAAVVMAGCVSFHETQMVQFVDDDGRFLSVVYGYGDEDHATKWTSPVNGNVVELKSKLRVKVRMEGGRYGHYYGKYYGGYYGKYYGNYSSGKGSGYQKET